MITSLIDFIPFLIVQDHRVQFNYTRILEAVIIAVVAGMLSGYTTMKTLEVRIATIESQVSKIYNDIYSPSVGGAHD